MAETDIRKTGAQNYRQLQQENEIDPPQLGEDFLTLMQGIQRQYTPTSLFDPAAHAQQDVSTPLNSENDWWGRSQYDNPTATEEQMQHLGDIRYENQGWADVLANGAAKLVGTAATTFLSGVVGLPWGIGTAIKEGRFSGVWDNEVTEALSNVDDWFENNFTNYKSEYQQQAPWWDTSNLFSMNFIADSLVKNAGFMIGAAASGGLAAGTMGTVARAMNFVNKLGKVGKVATGLASSLYSATGEGMIEAKQGVEERNKLEIQRLDDALNPEYEELAREQQEANALYDMLRGQNQYYNPETGRVEDPAYTAWRASLDDIARRRQELDGRKKAAMDEIMVSGRTMGNRILLGNMAVLTLDNYTQWAKGFTKSFENARHVAEVVGQTEKPMFTNILRAGKDIADGYIFQGNKGLGRAVALTKGLVTEGSEEMNQQWISSAADAYYNRKDVNDYWKIRLEPESLKDAADATYSVGQAISKGFEDSWGNPDQWEQFVVGGITGLVGTPMPTKVFNQDKTKSKWNPSRYFSWEGGAIKELNEFNDAYKKLEENVADLNAAVKEPGFKERVQRLGAHTALQKVKEYAAAADDKKLWKDADDKQTIHDIQAFVRAGRVDDLRALYRELQGEISDEDIEKLIGNTSGNITAQQDKERHDAQMDSAISEEQKKMDAVKQKLDALDAQAEKNKDNAEELAKIDEQRRNTRVELAQHSNAIQDLLKEKNDYVGRESKGGLFLTKDGNAVTKPEEIREMVKHNGEELERKLDSYLESVDQVLKDSRGKNLSKDQEDNLAYLHNLSKESMVRASKIVIKNRKNLPTYYRVPAIEAALFKLTDNKNIEDPNEIVEVNTSGMKDDDFATFFIHSISNDSWIKDNKADRDNDENWKNIAATHHQLYVASKGDNPQEEKSEFDALQKDLEDVENLYGQSKLYQQTLKEYMQDPEKLDKDKAEVEDKINKQRKKEIIKKKFSGKSVQDINDDIANGVTDLEDLDILADLAESEDDPELKNMKDNADKAGKVRAKQAGIKSKIQDASKDLELPDSVLSDLEGAVDRVAAAADDEMQLNLDNIWDEFDLENGDNEVKDQVQDLLAVSMEAQQADEDSKADIPDNVIEETGEADETGSDPVVQAPSSTAIPKVKKESNTEHTPLPPVNTRTQAAVDRVVERMNRISEEPSGKGTWRSTTRRYGREKGDNGRWHTTRKAYHELLTDKTSVLYRRSKAIWEYLDKDNVWDRVESPDNNNLKPGSPIHFMVRDFSQEIYGKPFSELTEEEKPYALVTLMLDDNMEILGDLPLAQFEPTYGMPNETQQVKELKSTQEMLFKAFEEKKAKTGCMQAVADKKTKDGAENLNLTFNNRDKSPFLSEVSQILEGMIPFSEEYNTLNDVMGDSNLLLGVTVAGETMATSKDKKDKRGNAALNVRTGQIGQSYLLLRSSSGALVPVPFYTKAFNAQQHAGTEFYQMLRGVMVNLVNGALKKDNSNFKYDIDQLQALLQVVPQEGAKSTIELTRDNVILHLQSLTDASSKMDIPVPRKGNASEIAVALINQLNGVNINISLDYLNSEMTVRNGKKASYNKVIGAIADVNLPKNTTHTLNNGFLIKLSTQAGLKRNTVKYKQTGIHHEVIGGRDVKIDTDTFTAYEVDPETKVEVPVEGDEEVNLFLAKLKASQQADKTKRFTITLDGEIRTFDPIKGEFVKASKGVGVNAGEPSLHEQKKGRKPDKEEKPVAGPTDSSSIPIPDNPPPVNEDNVDLDLNMDDIFMGPEQPAKKEEKKGEKKEEKAAEDNTQGPEAPKKDKGITTAQEATDTLTAEGILNKRNMDAWNAVPDNLKVKLVRMLLRQDDEVSVVWAKYGNKQEEMMNFSSYEELKKQLTKMNLYAKRNDIQFREDSLFRRVDEEKRRKTDIRRERRWLARNLPMFNTEERLHFIQGLIEIPGEKSWAWGRFSKGIITLSDMAARGTLYHEAFHAVTQTLLSDEELDALYNAAVKYYKENDPALVEELLAEDFRKYVQREETPIIGPILRFFRRIKHAMLNFAGYKNPVKDLFYKIDNGEFQESIPRDIKGENAFYRQIRTDRMLSVNNPKVQQIKRAFEMKNWKGQANVLGRQWSSFKKAWVKEGYTPVAYWHKDTYGTGMPGYVWYGVRTNQDEYFSKLDSRRRKQKERFQAEQARKGVSMRYSWNYLSNEAQMDLLDSGITEVQFNSMSLEEQEQYVECHT